jgi:hypothetical protein
MLMIVTHFNIATSTIVVTDTARIFTVFANNEAGTQRRAERESVLAQRS